MESLIVSFGIWILMVNIIPGSFFWYALHRLGNRQFVHDCFWESKSVPLCVVCTVAIVYFTGLAIHEKVYTPIQTSVEPRVTSVEQDKLKSVIDTSCPDLRQKLAQLTKSTNAPMPSSPSAEQARSMVMTALRHKAVPVANSMIQLRAQAEMLGTVALECLFILVAYAVILPFHRTREMTSHSTVNFIMLVAFIGVMSGWIWHSDLRDFWAQLQYHAVFLG